MNKIVEVPESFSKAAHITEKKYREWYRQSLEDPETFWGERANEFIDWYKPFGTVKRGDFENINMQWYIGGKLNACFNCIDRHLKNNGQKTAIIWEGDDPNEHKKITYQELFELVSKFSNALKKFGIQKGDRVCIYLPMIPELAIVMLACARIGAIHSVVFGGFSSEALKTRILDSDCKMLITADEGVRSGKRIPLKENADLALKDCPNVKTVIVVKRTGNPIHFENNRDFWYHEALTSETAHSEPEMMDSEDPLFILYTSGSTGRPKGILHTTGGYLVYTAMSHKYIFDIIMKKIFTGVRLI